MSDFSEVSVSKEKKKKSKVSDFNLKASEFAELAFKDQVRFSKQWLKLLRWVIGVSNSFSDANTKISRVVENAPQMDANQIKFELQILFDIMQYKAIIDDLELSTNQKELLLTNYINKKTLPKQPKDKLEDIKEIFEKLSGKK